jgi:hypothetical protein
MTRQHEGFDFIMGLGAKEGIISRRRAFGMGIYMFGEVFVCNAMII